MSAVSLAKRMPDNIPSFAEAAAKHRSLHNSSGKQPCVRCQPARGGRLLSAAASGRHQQSGAAQDGLLKVDAQA